MMFITRLIPGVVIGFLITVSSLHAEVAPEFLNIYSRVYSTRHGLPSNHVSHITQDDVGRIWVATQAGVASYDGQRFTEYPFPDRQDASLFFSFIFHDSRHRTWIGTTYGVAFIENGEVKTLPINWPDAPPRISAIVEDNCGKIWATDSRRLFRIDNRSLDVPKWDNLPENVIIYRLRTAQDQTVWLGTNHGMFVLKDGSVTPHSLDLNGSILEFELETDMSGWLIDETNAVYRFEGERAVRQFHLPDSAGRTVLDMTSGHTGALWIATYRGLYLWQHDSLENFRFRNGLASNVVMDVFVDREGGFWYGSDNGLGKIPGLMFTRLMPTPDLPISSVAGITRDSRGRYWFAANEGILRLDESGIQIWGAADGLQDESAYAIMVYGDGVALLNANGLYRIDGNDTVSQLAEDTQNGFVQMMVQDETIWLCGETGLFRYRPADGIVDMNTYLGLPHVIPVNATFIDSRGQFWVATDGEGLFVSPDADPLRFESVKDLPSRRVFSVCEDIRRSIWAGTLAGVVNIENRTVRQLFNQRQGLVCDDVWTVICDRVGGVWISTSRGISSIVDGRVMNYDYNDGLSGEDFLSNCRFIDDKGRIWFGGFGITIVDPSEKMPSIRPLTHFRYARVNGESLKNGQKIPSGRNTFEFGLMCSSFRSEYQNRFRYQLKGYDEFRSEPTASSDIRYTNLPRGRYILVAESCNRDGQWSDIPVLLSFEVLPAWWERRVVWLLGFLIVILMMRLLIRFRSYQLARTTHRLQEEVRRQTRVIQKQMERLEEQKNLMEQQAKIDDLTKLYNRRHFYRKLRDAWIMRRIDGSALSIIIFDLDYFKNINDTFGHLTGDAVLRQICQEIRNHVPSNGLAARFGGEEIVIMLLDMDLDGAFQLAETIRRSVENLELGCLDDSGLKVTLSGGVACRIGVDTSDTPDTLIRDADEALYKAKSGGRNRIMMAE
ncbi:diguanylate cyclase [bacterium]|nr:diguanylate cyclase [candidate division CSSED10-310 bacterium]